MPCSSCGGAAAAAAAAAAAEEQYTVTYPNGEKKVLGDHESRVEMTKTPGATRERVR
jgi:hypothetical protein